MKSERCEREIRIRLSEILRAVKQCFRVDRVRNYYTTEESFSISVKIMLCFGASGVARTDNDRRQQEWGRLEETRHESR